jgi:hypothetical protein
MVKWWNSFPARPITAKLWKLKLVPVITEIVRLEC